MNDAFIVGGFERQAKQPRDRNRAIDRQPSLGGDEVVKILAIHVGHGDELQATHISEIVYAQDVFVRYLAREQQLLLQPLHGNRISGQFGLHQLQSHLPADVAVVRFINLAHAAFTQQRLDAIAGSKLAAGR